MRKWMIHDRAGWWIFESVRDADTFGMAQHVTKYGPYKSWLACRMALLFT